MRKIKVLISLLVILSMTIGFNLLSRSNQGVLSNTKSSVNEDVVMSELSDTSKTWVIKNEAKYYKDITIAITPVNTEIKDGKVEVAFNVNVTEMLKAKAPKDLPVIRGMMRFINSEKDKLSPNEINAADNELNSWITELNGYIGKTETLNIDLKVVAELPTLSLTLHF